MSMLPSRPKLFEDYNSQALSDKGQKVLDKSFIIVSILFWVGLLYYAFTQSIPRAKVGIAFLGSVFLLFGIKELGEDLQNENWTGAILIGVASTIVVITTIYMYINFTVLYTVRVGYALGYEYTLAQMFIVSAIYLVYRAYGMNFVAIIVVGLGYGLFGNYIPGILGHGGIPLDRMLQVTVLSIEGFFGFLTRLTAAWIALFILFAGLLQGYGAFDLMIHLSLRVSKFVKSGVAQSAVFASMVMGMINGSTAANSAMTGSITIPLMKKNGIKSETAAGIESVASTAGQVLPPIMGATAFVIASLLSVSYIQVIAAGLVPGIVLVTSIAISVHYISVPQLSESQTSSIDTEQRSKQAIAIDVLQYGVPFGLLVYFLGILQWTVLSSALYSSLALMVSGIVVRLGKKSSLTSSGLIGNVHEASVALKNGLVTASETLVPIAIILAAINAVVDILLVTGVPGSLSLAIMDISGGILLVAAILAMIVCIVLGMGMPTVAAYLIVATLVAPTLINQFNIPEMAAHFFVFYCAILAAITLPIATSVAVTTGIAKSNFWKTGFQAIKIAFPLFILPFVFIFRPAIIIGSLSDKIFLGIFSFIGTTGIAYSLNYIPTLDHTGNYQRAGRVLILVSGIITMVYPSYGVSLVGSCVLLGVYLLLAVTPVQWLRKKVDSNI